MKRTIALILTLCMLAALLVCPVSAHTAQQQKDADALNHLGLFLGTGKGYELDAELNRNQSVMLLVRMLGKLTEAETGDDSHPFNDVPKWASKVVAYAYTAGLDKGYNATTYGGSDAVSDFQFLTMVLRALDYTDSGENRDFYYRESRALAYRIGLVDSDKSDNAFDRGAAVEIFWNALNTKLKDGSKTLAARLIAQGVFTQKQFDEAAEIAKNGKSGSGSGSSSDSGTTGGNKKPEDYTWEEYQAMSGAEREAHFKQFSSPEAYIQWLNKAKADYDKEHPTIEVGADGTIDLGKLTGKS